jgi:hypothetical protein
MPIIDNDYVINIQTKISDEIERHEIEVTRKELQDSVKALGLTGFEMKNLNRKPAPIMTTENTYTNTTAEELQNIRDVCSRCGR